MRLRRLLLLLATASLLAQGFGCANSTTGYGGSVYYGNSVHYDSFPGRVYRGPIYVGRPYY